MTFDYIRRLGGLIQQEVQCSISGKERRIFDLVVLIGKRQELLNPSRLFHSLSSRTFADLHSFFRPCAASCARSNRHIASVRENISVVGAFSRSFSIASVKGSSLQFRGNCANHIASLHFQGPVYMPPVAVMAVFGYIPLICYRSISNFTSIPQSGIATSNLFSSYSCCYGKVGMSLTNKERPNNFFLYGYFIYKVYKRKTNCNPLLGYGFEGIHTLSTVCSSADAARDVPYRSFTMQEDDLSSADSTELNTPIDRSLVLKSGSCYLPHPDKEETGGEDAHFICKNEQAVGMADGVGGWVDVAVGIDAGKYARELMSNSVIAVQEEPKGSIDPTRVLEKGYFSTSAQGSSTACIIALTDQRLHAVNLGDSGFMVVRDGSTVFRSPAQQHDFNFTYQLESGNSGDLPSSGQVFTIPVAPGDVIIAGTDGLFDNLYNNDITSVVVRAMRAGLGSQVTAQKIASLARERTQDKNRQTPFSAAAQEAGYLYYGGKLDDITVVVSYITSDHNEKALIKIS